jgi:hypothetical protein
MVLQSTYPVCGVQTSGRWWLLDAALDDPCAGEGGWGLLVVGMSTQRVHPTIHHASGMCGQGVSVGAGIGC